MAAVAALPDGPAPPDPIEQLLDATATLAERAVDELAEPEVHRELAALEKVRRRTQARQYRLADALRRRQAGRLEAAGEAPERAQSKADQQTRRELRDRLEWTASDACRASQVGRQMGDAPNAGDAFDEGELSGRHAQELGQTLQWFHGEEREDAERWLLERARVEDAVTFGHTCRRLLAQRDHEAADAAQQRRHARRSARVATTPDGMTSFSGQLSGIDGEHLQTAVNAFRRPNAPGESRAPEQATADAFVAMARAALRAGEAPTQHGVRPHVVVTIDHEDVLRQAGVVETSWSGPVPFAEVRRLLADCGVARLLVDSREVPVEAGEEVRNVPAGVARGLQLRDRTCIAVGCDVPAAWCDVMHLETPYRFQGRLTLDTAALGCRHHHQLFDHQKWRVTWREGRPVLHPPGRPPPQDPPTRGRGPDDRGPPKQ